MPPLPEFGDGYRLVGRVKVLGQRNIKHVSDTNCHIAVSAEIKIKLERKAERDDKNLRTVQSGQSRKTIVHSSSKGISKDHFFEQPQGKNVDSSGKIGIDEAAVFHILELGDRLIVQYNRAGDQLRKERYKKCIFVESIACDFSSVRVRQKRNLLKGKKTDSKGQQNILEGEGCMKQGIHVFQKEIKIFEIKNDCNIDDNSKYQNQLFGGLFC